MQLFSDLERNVDSSSVDSSNVNSNGVMSVMNRIRSRWMGLVWVALIGLGACQTPPNGPTAGRQPGSSQAELQADGVIGQAKPVNHQALLRSIPSWDPQAGLSYTSPADRLSQVKVGRPDPFAPTETIVVNVDSGSVNSGTVSAGTVNPQPVGQVTGEASAELAPLSLAPLQLTPVPVAISASLGNNTQLPTVSVPASQSVSNSAAALPVQNLPPLSVTPTVGSTALSPTHLADQMQLKGIVELNQQWQAIVWEPQSSVSKTVRAGDVLGNGQVKVRRIEQTSSGLLRLVLEQNGIEVIHTVS